MCSDGVGCLVDAAATTVVGTGEWGADMGGDIARWMVYRTSRSFLGASGVVPDHVAGPLVESSSFPQLSNHDPAKKCLQNYWGPRQNR